MNETNNNIRILIADDHALLLDGIDCIISFDPECTVVAKASTGQEALDLYMTHKPDISILDIEMPTLNGIEVTQSIINDNPQAKVIVLSGHGEREWEQRATQAGAVAYLSKVSVIDKLVAVIHSLRPSAV